MYSKLMLTNMFDDANMLDYDQLYGYIDLKRRRFFMHINLR